MVIPSPDLRSTPDPWAGDVVRFDVYGRKPCPKPVCLVFSIRDYGVVTVDLTRWEGRELIDGISEALTFAEYSSR